MQSVQAEDVVRSIADSMCQPIMIVSPELIIRYVNTSAASLIGGTGDALTGRRLTDTSANILGVEVARHVPAILESGTDTLFESTFADRVWLCHAVPLRAQTGAVTALAVSCHDVSHIHEHARAQLAAQKELTDALVREVRHRVKNHLQGIVGLLRQHQTAHPHAAESLNAAINQLLTIGAVYGLEARASDDRIYLCSVVGEVVNALRATYRAVHLQSPPYDRRATLSEQHSVPIALAVNELITNAIKHTPAQQESKITVDLRFTSKFARLIIFNSPARLPDKTEERQRSFHGAGLNLVNALLPIGYSSLSMANEGNGVVTVLTLLPPVVTLNIPSNEADDCQ